MYNPGSRSLEKGASYVTFPLVNVKSTDTRQWLLFLRPLFPDHHVSKPLRKPVRT
jgi:hypothetical protein